MKDKALVGVPAMISCASGDNIYVLSYLTRRKYYIEFYILEMEFIRNGTRWTQRESL